MIRVKTFDCGTVSKLEKEINDFLETMDIQTSFQLIDIKYNSYNYREDRIDYHSAMVIYKI